MSRKFSIIGKENRKGKTKAFIYRTCSIYPPLFWIHKFSSFTQSTHTHTHTHTHTRLMMPGVMALHASIMRWRKCSTCDPSKCHTIPPAALLLVPLNQYTSVGYTETSSGCSVDLPHHFHKNSFITKQNINPMRLDLRDILYKHNWPCKRQTKTF
jgi:hypothetical protein